MTTCLSEADAAPSEGPAQGRPLGELLAAGAVWLRARGVGDGDRLCRLLAEHLLQTSHLKLPLERRLTASEVTWLRQAVVRLGENEPLQYVLGEWDFRFLSLKVDKRALIPRPETEELVSLVLQQQEVWRMPQPRICDVGTGSGAIVLALADEAPTGEYVAIDNSAAALSLARENAIRLGLATQIEFLEGDGCAPLPLASCDLIVSNPPYITTAECNELPRRLREYEPWSALDGGCDGLVVIRQIVNDAALRLKPGGWCLLEIGARQGGAVAALLRRAGFDNVTIRRDLAGHERYAAARI